MSEEKGLVLERCTCATEVMQYNATLHVSLGLHVVSVLMRAQYLLNVCYYYYKCILHVHIYNYIC